MLTALLALALAADPSPPGHLVVVGGGTIGPAIAARTLELAGGPAAKVLIVPHASSSPDAGPESAAAWRERGANDVTVLDLADPAAARKAIAAADLIWLGGGDQNRLTAALQKADCATAIRDRYRKGATVGGTSAGAAAQSGVMITGEAPLNAVRRGAAVTAEGLDLWPGVIVDQHFVRRQRFNRLLAAVLDRPKLVGVGIDEGTAAVVTGTKFAVIGAGQVLVIDARKATVPAGKKDELGAANGVALHVLTAGMTFNLGQPP
ncbi:MAG TPA: cyanophycinase [Gemmataceae bacterium]|jgi:cyanophycinase